MDRVIRREFAPEQRVVIILSGALVSFGVIYFIARKLVLET